MILNLGGLTEVKVKKRDREMGFTLENTRSASTAPTPDHNPGIFIGYCDDHHHQAVAVSILEPYAPERSIPCVNPARTDMSPIVHAAMFDMGE